MIKVFKVVEAQYKNIERLSLVVLTTTIKPKPYFQVHRVMVKIIYLIQQVLNKPYLAKRMVSWIVELSEYDIQYMPMGVLSNKY